MLGIKRNTLEPMKKVNKKTWAKDSIKNFDKGDNLWLSGYVPLNHVTIIRTTYSNLIVKNNKKNPYANLWITRFRPDGTQFYDEDNIISLSSIALKETFDVSKIDKQTIARYVDYQFLGLLFINEWYERECYAITQLVIDDGHLKEFTPFLNDGFSFYNISDIDRKEYGDVHNKIIDEIIEVKNEK